MTMKMYCQICLRSDKKLRVIDNRLSEFHDELCDFYINMLDPVYCMQCEHMLRKLKNFKTKCLLSVKIMKKQKKAKPDERTEPSLLYTLLPPTSLGVCNTTYYCEVTEQCVDNVRSVLRPHLVIITVDNLPEDVSDKEHSKNITDEGIKEENQFHNTLKEQLEELKTEDFEEVLLENDAGVRKDDELDMDDEGVNSEEDDDDDDQIIDDQSEASEQSDMCSDKVVNRTKKENLAEGTDDDEFHAEFDDDDDFDDIKKKIAKKQDGGKGKLIDKIVIDKRKGRKKRVFDEVNEIIKTDDGRKRNMVKKHKMPFNKERLISELKAKFASYGELTTATGDAVIDKEFILSIIEDKVSEHYLKHMWKTIFDKSLTPKVIKLLNCIQNKYKFEYESVFDIEYLNTDTKVREELSRRKYYDSYLKAKYKCEKCYLTFPYSKKLEMHMQAHEDSAGNFVCTICNVRYKRKKNLSSHRATHEAVYKCKLCPLITYHKGSMIHHYHLHKGKKYKCETCGAILGSYSAYHTHRSYRHSQPHVCVVCARAFFSEVGLKWHRTREHEGEEPAMDVATSVRCDKCELTFPTEEVYKKHVAISHERVPTNPRDRYRGGRRKGVVGQRKPIQTCRVCNLVGPSIGWLTLHFRTEHPEVDMPLLYADKKTNLCHICGKGYSSVYALRDHLLKHSGVRPFACASCPKRFHTTAARNTHQALHLPPKHACGYCGKKFHSPSGLYNHMNFHTGDRRYKCKICEKGFLHRSTLNEHVRGVHNNVRRVRKRPAHAPGARGGHEEDTE